MNTFGPCLNFVDGDANLTNLSFLPLARHCIAGDALEAFWSVAVQDENMLPGFGNGAAQHGNIYKADEASHQATATIM